MSRPPERDLFTDGDDDPSDEDIALDAKAFAFASAVARAITRAIAAETSPTLDIAAIEARTMCATPGPWAAIGQYDCRTHAEWRDVCGPDGEALIGHETAGESTRVIRNADHDAEFIAHARTDVPMLVARVYELEAALAKALGGRDD